MALTPATATIDAGRLLTLERRRKFANLELTILGPERQAKINESTLPGSYGILDDGNIAAAIIAVMPKTSLSDARSLAVFIEHDVRSAMRDWANGGYQGICLPAQAYADTGITIIVA